MKEPKVLLVHPGTQHSKQLALQLYEKGLLFKFCTGIIIPGNNPLIKFLFAFFPEKIRLRLNNRIISIPFRYLSIFPVDEIRVIKKLRKPKVIKEEVFFKRNRRFQEKVSDKLLKNSDVIISFDTSSWILAEKAKHYKKKIIIDYTTAEPVGKAEILKQVAHRFPEWKSDLQTRYEEYNKTDLIEFAFSDRIVVASSYTKETLIARNVSEDKICVNPYGIDIDIFCPAAKLDELEIVKFLFVGSVSALKGIPLLLTAWESIDHSKAELWIVGSISEGIRKIIGERKGVKIMGSFSKEELPRVYRSCDVFVFPSYSDGFGQVILEALASGLPVITTENTGGKDLITNGKEGFIMPAGSRESLIKSMSFFIDNSHIIKTMSRWARETAVKYTWQEYGDRWRSIIEDVLEIQGI